MTNENNSGSVNVTVIGIGVMGGGIARALLASEVTRTVVGYDRAENLVSTFHEETVVAGKSASESGPQTLREAVREDTDFAILVLVNEAQCDNVCFGSDENLISLLKEGSCVILCSTVSATWARRVRDKFNEKGIHFVDCPISGGPLRARAGELTMMASGDEKSLLIAMPILNAAGREIHVISGGAGMGSTVKMVHQLLAGVHICCAAEALALAAKAGVNVEQMYQIVNGAAGASWMFQDRGKRMIEGEPNVMSALNIFVKDLDIVHSEAKTLQSPIPIASVALQQFVSCQSMGFGSKDDSQVVKVYEGITGVSVGKKKGSSTKLSEGDNVGDIWKLPDGTAEQIIDVGDEPSHVLLFSNEYVRAFKVSFPPKDATLAHRHEEDSLYFYLVEGGIVVDHQKKGCDPFCDQMKFGEIRYGPHKTEKPLIHKLTNLTDEDVFAIDTEILKSPPIVSESPLEADRHELIKTKDRCRVYKLTLPPGESITVTYPFFYCSIVLRGSLIKSEVGGDGGIAWEETMVRGDVKWKDPVVGLKQTNVGESTYEVYIAEWR